MTEFRLHMPYVQAHHKIHSSGFDPRQRHRESGKGVERYGVLGFEVYTLDGVNLSLVGPIGFISIPNSRPRSR